MFRISDEYFYEHWNNINRKKKTNWNEDESTKNIAFSIKQQVFSLFKHSFYFIERKLKNDQM